MELALYCPNCGYYEREEDIIGRRGDYYTSVSVGSLFGELLAFQFAEWLQQDEMRIVEAGAHGGDLARDILGWMREHRPGLFARLEYWIVEPSEARQRWQRQKLADYGNKVRWVKDLAELTGSASPHPHGSRPAGLRGIVFSNEFLDALPVHRLGWDAKARAWFEWGVTLHAGRFVWSRIPHEGSGHSRSGIRRCRSRFPISSCPLPMDCWKLCPTGLRSNFARRRSNGGAKRRWPWDAASCLRLIMV